MTARWLTVFAFWLLAVPTAEAQELPILGRTLPLQEAVISAPRSGHLIEFRFEIADQLTAGDLIARFSCEIEHAQRAAALAASRALELQYRSQQQLREFASTSALEVDIARAEWERSLAEADIHAAALAQCDIVAPFDGVISFTSVRNHEHVSAGQEIARIIDDSQKFFEFLAPVSWIQDVGIGQPVTVVFEAIEAEVEGHIERISPEVDAISQTVRMRAILEDGANIIPVGVPGRVHRADSEQAR
ncbi:efflux RND transporter periplasmic adaptor subunit [Paradonghicola geojensis]|nr:efflux RND transporter periplasmic adaptor subunit [Marivivens geojensis]